MCSLLWVMVNFCSGSKITMSASLPTAISPLFAIRTCGRCRWRDIHHFFQADPTFDHPFRMHQHQQGFDPGGTVGDFFVIVLAVHVLFPLKSKGQWSVATTWTSPLSRPSQRASLLSWVRNGGDMTYLAPSKVGLFVPFFGQEQILGAGFGIYIDTP